MTLSTLVSGWSFGYDLIFESVFAIISLILAIFAFQIYKLAGEDKSRLFGVSFLLISISYFVQIAFNLVYASNLGTSICTLANLPSNNAILYYGNYLHFLFMIIGLAVLLYMTFDINHSEILWFLVILSTVSLLVSSNEFYAFYLLSTIYLAFITWYFIRNYFRKKQKLSLMTAVAFSFLLFGSFHFFLSVNHQLYFIIGYFLELIAYILILLNLILVQKK